MTWLQRARDALLPSSAKADAPAYRLGDIEIATPWARAPSPDAKVGGGFFTLTNKGGTPDRLVSASSPAAECIEIHAIKVEGADLRMRERPDGLALAAGTTLTLKPRGYHLLLVDLKTPLQPGVRIPVTLVFEKAGSIEVELVGAEPGIVGWKAV